MERPLQIKRQAFHDRADLRLFLSQHPGQQAIAAQGATVDLSDAVNASNLQTVGTIRANAAQREADISQLEAATHSADPAQHTEMATFSASTRPC